MCLQQQSLCALILGILPFKVLLLWYLVGLVIFLLNSLRTLSAHAYRNDRKSKDGDLQNNISIQSIYLAIYLLQHYGPLLVYGTMQRITFL